MTLLPALVPAALDLDDLDCDGDVVTDHNLARSRSSCVVLGRSESATGEDVSSDVRDACVLSPQGSVSCSSGRTGGGAWRAGFQKALPAARLVAREIGTARTSGVRHREPRIKLVFMLGDSRFRLVDKKREREPGVVVRLNGINKLKNDTVRCQYLEPVKDTCKNKFD